MLPCPLHCGCGQRQHALHPLCVVRTQHHPQQCVQVHLTALNRPLHVVLGGGGARGGGWRSEGSNACRPNASRREEAGVVWQIPPGALPSPLLQ